MTSIAVTEVLPQSAQRLETLEKPKLVFLIILKIDEVAKGISTGPIDSFNREIQRIFKGNIEWSGNYGDFQESRFWLKLPSIDEKIWGSSRKGVQEAKRAALRIAEKRLDCFIAFQ